MNSIFKTIFLKLIALIFALSFFFANVYAKNHDHQPEIMSDLVVYDLQGRELSIDQLEGNVVLLHFWATWCAGCTKEMEHLNKLQKAIKKDPIIILPVSEDFKGHKVVEQFYHAHNLRNLTAFIDPNNKLFRELKISTLPTSIIIDASGKNVAIIKKPVDWTQEKNIKFLKKFVAQKTSTNQDYLKLLNEQKIFSGKEKTSKKKNTTKIIEIPNHAETYLAPPETENEEGSSKKQASKIITNMQNKELSFKVKRPINSSTPIEQESDNDEKQEKSLD